VAIERRCDQPKSRPHAQLAKEQDRVSKAPHAVFGGQELPPKRPSNSALSSAIHKPLLDGIERVALKFMGENGKTLNTPIRFSSLIPREIDITPRVLIALYNGPTSRIHISTPHAATAVAWLGNIVRTGLTVLTGYSSRFRI
jgi:hypothetical protein